MNYVLIKKYFLLFFERKIIENDCNYIIDIIIGKIYEIKYLS